MNHWGGGGILNKVEADLGLIFKVMVLVVKGHVFLRPVLFSFEF